MSRTYSQGRGFRPAPAADHGVQNGEAASTVVAAGKQPVLSSDGNGPQRALWVVIDALRAIAQEQGERIPLPQRVRNRHSQESSAAPDFRGCPAPAELMRGTEDS